MPNFGVHTLASSLGDLPFLRSHRGMGSLPGGPDVDSHNDK
jgi:hypothetical protein